MTDTTPIPPEPKITDDPLTGGDLDTINKNSPFQPVFFPLDSFEVDGGGQQALNTNAGILKKYPTWVITIEGHCDERGTAEYNLALGEKRALAAKTYLVSLGIPADRLRTVSYGKEFPFDPGHDEGAWQEPPRPLRGDQQVGVEMRLSRIVLPAVVSMMLVPTVASAAANKEHLQLMAEIRMLQEQQQQLQGLLGSLQDTLKTVATKIDDQSAAMRKAMADQTLATSNIGDNVRVLREKTDETNVRISTMGQELESLRQTIASQPATQPGQVSTPATTTDPALAPPAGAQPPPPQPATPPASLPQGMSPQRMYDTSFDDYQAGRYDLGDPGVPGLRPGASPRRRRRAPRCSTSGCRTTT